MLSIAVPHFLIRAVASIQLFRWKWKSRKMKLQQARQILIIGLILLVISMGLFSFLKGKKNAAGQERFPKESFSILQATDQNAGLIFITANYAYKDYKFKSDYPWFLWIEVETKDKNKNGHPTSGEAKILNQMEDLIDAELKKVCTSHYIARTTLNGSRELLYYVDDPEKANPVLQKLVSDPNPIRQFQYKIEQDKDWDKVNYILNPK
jgi:hypothetical protein